MVRRLGWVFATVVSSTVIGLGAASAADMAVKAMPAPVLVNLVTTGTAGTSA